MGSLASETSCFVSALFHTLALQTHSNNLMKNRKNAFNSLSVVAYLSLQNSSNMKNSSSQFLNTVLNIFARQLTCTSLLTTQGCLERFLVCQIKHVWIPRPFLHQPLLKGFVKWLGTGHKFDLEEECVYANNTILRATFFCTIGAFNGMLLTLP